MSHELLCFLILLGPSALIGLLGLRALRKQTDSSWADYADVANVLSWLAAPGILVTAPRLHAVGIFPPSSAASIGVGAILLFCVLRVSFSPHGAPSLTGGAKQLLAESTLEISVCVVLVGAALNGKLTEVTPSATLFLQVLWFSFVCQMILGWLLKNNIRDRELEAGELRDRIVEIANQRGVRLEQIRVLKTPPDCAQCLNALAVYGTTIALFADLISRLNKTEVDAVVEHEVGHIADERMWTLDSALHYGCYLALLALAYFAEDRIIALQMPWLLSVLWMALFVLPELLTRWYSRAAERRANRNVAQLTDPESAISAEYKVHLLNHVPLSRPLWSRLTSTHPCAAEEIGRIARSAGITDYELRRVYDRAQAEISAPLGERYEIAVTEEPQFGDASSEDQLVPRPGSGAGLWVFVPAILACVVFMFGYIFLMCVINEKLPMWLNVILAIVGIVGCILVLALPVEIAGRRRLRRMRERIRARLESKYGTELASRSLLLDVLLPEWTDRDQPWQGALLHIYDGYLTFLGEAAEARIPLAGKVHVSRWADHNSSGRDARLVLIAYESGNMLQTITVRPLGDPERDEPGNWKQLEKHIQALIVSAGVANTRLEDTLPEESSGFAWSFRVPVAIAILVSILIVAGYLGGMTSDGKLMGRIVTCFFATCIAGPPLLAWVTRAYKPDKK